MSSASFTYQTSLVDANAPSSGAEAGQPSFDATLLASLMSQELNMNFAALLPTTPVNNMSSQHAAVIAPIQAMLAQAAAVIATHRVGTASGGVVHHAGFLHDEPDFTPERLAAAQNRVDTTVNDKPYVEFDEPETDERRTAARAAAKERGGDTRDYSVLSGEIAAFSSFLDHGAGTTLLLVPLATQAATEKPAKDATPPVAAAAAAASPTNGGSAGDGIGAASSASAPRRQ